MSISRLNNNYFKDPNLKNYINELSDPILLQIFQNLSLKDRENLFLTNKRLCLLFLKQYSSPIHELRKTHLTAARIIIESGFRLDTCDELGASPLYIACMKEEWDIAKLLIEKGANVNLTTHDGDSPLRLAAYFGNQEVTMLLIKAGAKLDVQNAIGHFPLYSACMQEHWNIAKILIAKGANVNLTTKFERRNSLLHLCAMRYDSEVASMILDRSQNINIKNQDGCTALHIAAVFDNIVYLRQLLANKAKIDVQDRNGETPIHLTGEACSLRCMKELIEKGCNLLIRNQRGLNPYAEFYLNKQLAEQRLREQRVDPSYEEGYKNLLQQVKEHAETIKMLRDKTVMQQGLRL